MIDNPIKTYINKFLSPFLDSYTLNPDITSKITMDIENRLRAIIGHWNDFDFRNTILFTGIEEAYFYEPDGCDLEIKSLINIAVRNSLIENLSSTNTAAKTLGLSKPVIKDKDIPNITKQAIDYFSEIDLSKLSTELVPVEKNPYLSLPTDYPVTWKALSYLSTGPKQYHRYPPMKEPQLELDNYDGSINLKNNIDMISDVQSGMDIEFSNGLNETLELIISKEVDYFFVDSFKMITRHPEKLFKVMEIVLRANASIITFNYYISNGYVASRKGLLRPAHYTNDIIDKLNDFSGLGKAHRESLKGVKKQLLQE